MIQSHPFVSPNGRVVKTKMYGEQFFFLATAERDAIQKHHLAGEFYEGEELNIIKQHFPVGGAFIDIGANVGNHSLFVAKFLDANSVLPIEVNPVAYNTLIANMHLNDCLDRVDISCLGIGVSDKPTHNGSMYFKKPNFMFRNIGAGRVSEDGGEPVLKPADELIADRAVDFIKIDVEGMEMKVLDSLPQTISRCRPSLFVEVEQVNQDAFDEWVSRNAYRVVDRFKRYRENENFMLVPMRERKWDRLRNELDASREDGLDVTTERAEQSGG